MVGEHLRAGERGYGTRNNHRANLLPRGGPNRVYTTAENARRKHLPGLWYSKILALSLEARIPDNGLLFLVNFPIEGLRRGGTGVSPGMNLPFTPVTERLLDFLLP